MSDAAVYTAWSRRHAALMVAGCAVSAAWGRPWPLALAAVPSFGVWLWRSRGTFTPRGDFGAGNAVTALRLAMTLALGVVGPDWPGLALAAALAAQALLDAVDGWLARRLGAASVFGAAFDMETDALLILIAAMQLWQRGRLGVWILSAGLLRYAYVLSLAIVPSSAGPVPRSRLGRHAFLGLLGGLTAAFARADALGTALAVLGTAAVVISFAQSFWWSYRRR